MMNILTDILENLLIDVFKARRICPRISLGKTGFQTFVLTPNTCTVLKSSTHQRVKIQVFKGYASLHEEHDSYDLETGNYLEFSDQILIHTTHGVSLECKGLFTIIGGEEQYADELYVPVFAEKI